MPKRHSHERLPEDEDLVPVDAISHVSREAQIENMHDLRAMQNAIAGAHIDRDERIYALTLSNVLSRRDMARATGQSVSRIGQIVRERADAQRAGWTASGLARTARHTVGFQAGSQRPAVGTPAGYEDRARLVAAFERWRTTHLAHGDWNGAAIALEQAHLTLADGEAVLRVPHRLGDEDSLADLKSGLRLLRARYGVDGVDLVELSPAAAGLRILDGWEERGTADKAIGELADALEQLSGDLRTSAVRRRNGFAEVRDLDLLERAVRIVVEFGTASWSLLQRHLPGLDHEAAKQLVAALERHGVISTAEAGSAPSVLLREDAIDAFIARLAQASSGSTGAD